MGPSAFAGCAYLGEVTFTDVETPLQEGISFGELIGGGYQFDSCPHLGKIALSNNIVTIPAKFAQKSGTLHTVIWGENLEKIGAAAFSECTSLKTADLSGTKITEIGDSAFGKSGVESPVFPGTLISIGQSAFEETPIGTETQTVGITLPGSLKSMGPSAFAGCAYLGEVTFTDAETPLQEGISFGELIGGGYQFDSCPHLTKITLSNNIVTIPAKFAQKSGALHTVIWGENLEKIGAAAFSECTSLKTADLSGTKITEIGDSAFGKSGVESPAFPGTLISIGQSAFEETPIGTETQTAEIILPGSLKSMGASAFSQCAYLGSVIFKEPEHPLLDGLSFGAFISGGFQFASCPNLTQIVLCSNVQELPERFAEKCPSLSAITLPASVKKIPQGAFYVDVPTPTVISGDSVLVTEYDWAADNRVVGALFTIEYIDNIPESGRKVVQSALKDYFAQLIPNPFTYKGYAFRSWNTRMDGTGTDHPAGSVIVTDDPTEKCTLYAIWTPVVYTITYNYNGAKAVANPGTYKVSDPDIVLKEPVKDGSDFVGWFDQDGNKVTKIPKGTTGNLVLTAGWNEYEYTIVYHGASEYTGRTDPYTVSGVKFSEPVKMFDAAAAFPVKEEYKGEKAIVAWTTEDNGRGMVYSLTKSFSSIAKTKNEVVDLYAVWGAMIYEIRYDLAGGTNNKAAPYAYMYNAKKKINIKAPTRTGYQFTGWLVSGEGKDYFSTNKILGGAKGDIILTATWKPVVFHVWLVKNSPSASLNAGAQEKYQGVVYGSGQSFAEAGIYTNPCCDFMGWNTKANGKGIAVSATGGVIDISTLLTKKGTIKLYAQWSLRRHTVTYVNVVPEKISGSSIMIYKYLSGVKNKNKTVFTEDKAMRLKKPSKKGYKFEGWYSDMDLKTKVTQIPKYNSADIVLYGKWTKQ